MCPVTGPLPATVDKGLTTFERGLQPNYHDPLLQGMGYTKRMALKWVDPYLAIAAWLAMSHATEDE